MLYFLLQIPASCFYGTLELFNVSVACLNWYLVKAQKDEVVLTSVGSYGIMWYHVRTLAVALVLPPRREARGADLRYQCVTSLTSPQSRWVLVLIIIVRGKEINEFVGTSNKLTKYITRLVTSGRCQRWPAGHQFNSAALIRPISTYFTLQWSKLLIYLQ